MIFQTISILVLYAFTIERMWKDRKEVLPEGTKPLRRRYIWNAVVGTICVAVILYDVLVALLPGRKVGRLVDWLYFGYMVLQGIRAWVQARREREAWKLAAVREVMES